MASIPTVSIIIPVYNGGGMFRRCLASIEASTWQPQEVIVVADGETDGSGERARRFGARVLRNAVPHGPARARNQGGHLASGDLLFFMDADVELHADTLARAVSAFAHDPDLAALIGSYDDAPGAPNFLSQYRNLLHHYVHQRSREDASTFWGACGVVRREVFEWVGGFDESYRVPSIEDIELGYRLRHAGFRIRLDAQLQVKHLKRWDAVSILKTDFLRRALPWSALILEERRLPNDLNVQTTSRISVGLAWGILGCLVAAVLWPVLLAAAAVLSAVFLSLNAPLYRFFHWKRGTWFMVRAIPWHGLYYLYSGLAFGLALLHHGFSQGPRRAAAST